MSIENSCRFVGRLGQDPELQYTPSGTALVKLGLAVNGRRKVDDEWVDETTWVNFTAFANAAENLAQYANKGDMLIIETQYKKNKYTDNAGDEQTGHDFIVREWKVTARVGGGGGSEEAVDVSDESDDEETLPF